MKEQRESVRNDVLKDRNEEYEVRSYEVSNVGSLRHLVFHVCLRKTLAPNGNSYKPIALAVHDDRSRLVCHVQWYSTETTEDLAHGLCQAFQKWQLPRVLMTDNGSARKSAEFLQGLEQGHGAAWKRRRVITKR